VIHPSISSLVVGSSLVALIFRLGVFSKKHRDFSSKASSVSFLICTILVIASFLTGFFSGVEGEIIKEHYFLARITLFLVLVSSLVVGLKFLGVSSFRYEILALILTFSSFVLIVLSGQKGNELAKTRLEQKLTGLSSQ